MMLMLHAFLFLFQLKVQVAFILLLIANCRGDTDYASFIGFYVIITIFHFIRKVVVYCCSYC